mmetsp:Transcript_10451/g.31943  ORF Transcript_10451/g.31943 Transcript_10451/m.31943 type:complete len:318 (-) Transcript_10451:1143-2096(-)
MLEASIGNVILATAGYDRTIRLWDLDTESTYRTLQFSESQVNDLCFLPDNKSLIVGGYVRATVFDVVQSNPNPSYVIDVHRGNVTAVGCEPEGRWMFSCSDDGTVKTWDTRSSECHRSFNGYSPINCGTIDPSGKYIFSGDQNGGLKVWDIVADKLMTELQPQANESIESVAVSADGSTLAVANYVGACFLWSLERGPPKFEPICRHQAHSRHVLKVAFSPEDPPCLAAGLDDGSVKIWRADRGKIDTEGSMPEVASFRHHARWVWDLTFASDCKTLFSASSDMKALLVDTESGLVLKTFEGHQKAITCLAVAEKSS